MAKRELSNTLKNLKFMQRAALREEKTKKEDEVKPDGSIFGTSTISRRCVVIMEGDPHPGAIKGRMSFQSFNPHVDKLNEEEAQLRQPAAETTVSKNQSGNISIRENGSPVEGPDCSNVDKTSNEFNGDLKRKQSEVMSEAQYPNKSPKNDKGDRQSSSKNSLGSFKKPKGDKLDWNVLRPPKC
ncbi:M-phase phosphoprotein 6 [Senna tora]|uniref:M-phase phosphoprotein 6 n=1 Tax=Senna tora TaxID=362788 RepID=A0A834SML6_9FABA|nr:M-phase phosphoprotein 6 [Senna tora]